MLAPANRVKDGNMSKLTQKAIKESFVKLVDKKPIDRITIKDITDECGISRNTFYYHYSDLPALVEELLMDSAEEVMQKYPTIDSLEDGIKIAAGFVLDNRRAVRHIYNSPHRYIYERCLMKVCRRAVASYFEMAVPESYLCGEERELMIDYYKCLCYGFISDWCENGMKDSYANDFSKLINIRSRMLGSGSTDLL